MNWGKAEQCNKTGNKKTAMFQDSEHLIIVIRQGVPQHCFKIGKSSAMYKDWNYLSIVSVLGIFQQGIKVEYTTTMY